MDSMGDFDWDLYCSSAGQRGEAAVIEHEPLPVGHYLRGVAKELSGMNAQALHTREGLAHLKVILRDALAWVEAQEEHEEDDHERGD